MKHSSDLITVFFGSSHNVFPIIEALKINFGLTLVITTQSEANSSIIPFCKSKGIEVVQVRSKEELENLPELKNLKPDLGVVADFGIIISKKTIDSFKHGVLNIHPSLLPKYRGATPVQTAILNGETVTGVSIIKLDEKMDHGPILIQESQQISPDDTSQSLYEILFREGARLLSGVIKPYIRKELAPVEQNHSDATFTTMLKRDDGFIDIESIPSFEKLDRMTRAYFPWPGVWTRAKVDEENEKLVKFLPFKRVQVEGKNEVGYKDFLNGYPNANPKLLNFLGSNAE